MSITTLVLVALAGVMFSPLAAHAQQAEGTPPARDIGVFETLNARVRTGQTIYLTDGAAQQTEGQLVRLSDNTITLLVRGEEREFARDGIRKLVRKGDSVSNGAAIGAGIVGGLGLLALINGPNDSGSGGTGPVIAAIGMTIGIGAGAGALIDYAIKGKTTVYRSRSAAVTASPLVVNRGAGVRFALRF